jgi:amidase
MVSAWFLTKVFVAFAPLSTVYAQYNTPVEFPLLLDATAEELSAGLESGAFTSLDLVQVRTTTSASTIV